MKYSTIVFDVLDSRSDVDVDVELKEFRSYKHTEINYNFDEFYYISKRIEREKAESYLMEFITEPEISAITKNIQQKKEDKTC